jgi:hypothetical protein
MHFLSDSEDTLVAVNFNSCGNRNKVMSIGYSGLCLFAHSRAAEVRQKCDGSAFMSGETIGERYQSGGRCKGGTRGSRFGHGRAPLWRV